MMRVAFCSAEVVPFSHAGGLGDVIGSLPKAIASLGVECVIITPLYGLVNAHEHHLEKTDITFDVHFYDKHYPIAIWKGLLPNSTVPVYFVDNHELFGMRQQVYPYGQPAWELEGFLIFSQAVFEFLRRLHYRPDILHTHDWHTASVTTTLSDIRPFDQYFSRTQSVFTIHNLHYQGVYGDINWLKEGILKADAITTVSPTYAREIQMPEFGAGLDGTIRQCHHKLSGILNGIDTDLYNPETDTVIAKNYTLDTAIEGKRACKEALQREMGLPIEPEVPLIGFVGRLADQKGLDILLPAMAHLEAKGEKMQWMILGTGNPKMEETLRALPQQLPNTRVFIGFDQAIARKIYSGADMFAMPSAFEPCGLGQMIALRYGTIPIVRSVGGLMDTVFDVREQPESGNGFKFDDYSSEAMEKTILDAVQVYHNHYPNLPSRAELIRRCMQSNYSWRQSAKAYFMLYTTLISPTSAILTS